jgi:carbon-monoxide dehydrogenase medium subunit
MKLPQFDYRSPETVDETVALLAEFGDEAKVLAGGQSLLPLLAMRLAQPAVLIDINRVSEFATITRNGQLTIGTLTRHRTAQRSDIVIGAVPMLSAALEYVGHDAIRTRGTIGGSTAHADPAAEIPTVIRTLGGSVVATSARGSRTIEAEDFFQGFLTTSLEGDELVTAVNLPIDAPNSGWSFHEFSRRNGDFAIVGTAVSVQLNADGDIVSARIGLSGVSDEPTRATEAEAGLFGASPNDESFLIAAETAAAEVSPSPDLHATVAYRRQLVKTLVRRCLTEATARAKGN